MCIPDVLVSFVTDILKNAGEVISCLFCNFEIPLLALLFAVIFPDIRSWNHGFSCSDIKMMQGKQNNRFYIRNPSRKCTACTVCMYVLYICKCVCVYIYVYIIMHTHTYIAPQLSYSAIEHAANQCFSLSISIVDPHWFYISCIVLVVCVNNVETKISTQTHPNSPRWVPPPHVPCWCSLIWMNTALVSRLRVCTRICACICVPLC